jgi:hypothetical protein
MYQYTVTFIWNCWALTMGHASLIHSHICRHCPSSAMFKKHDFSEERPGFRNVVSFKKAFRLWTKSPPPQKKEIMSVSHLDFSFLSILTKIRNYQQILVKFSIPNFTNIASMIHSCYSPVGRLVWRSCWSHFLNLALTPVYKLMSQHTIRTSSYEVKLSFAPVMQTHARVPSGKG